MSNSDNATLDPILFLALDCFRHPGIHIELLRGRQSLPAGVDVILLFALKHQGADDSHTDKTELYVASMFFIEYVLLAKESSHYRILGLDPSATEEAIKHNHRLLIRLFHPDRVGNDDLLRLDFAARINAAYNTLSHPDAKRAYDHSMVVSPRVDEVSSAHRPSQHSHVNTSRRERYPWWMGLPAFFLRRPTETILTSTALFSVLLIWIVFDGQRSFDTDAGNDSGLLHDTEVKDQIPLNIEVHKNPSVSSSSQFQTESPVVVSNQNQKRIDATERPVAPKTVSVASVNDVKKVTSTTDKEVLKPKDKNIETTGDKIITVQATPSVESKAILLGKSVKELHEVNLKIDQPEKNVGKPPRTQPLLTPVAEVVAVEQSFPNKAGMLPQLNAAESQKLRQDSQGEVGISAPPQTISAEPANDVDVANALLNRLLRSYETGNLPEFMAVFSPNAVTDGGGLDFIREDYRGLFSSTQRRHLAVKSMSWTIKQNVIYGEGRYTASVAYAGADNIKVTKGRLILEVSKLGQKPLISSINYTSDW